MALGRTSVLLEREGRLVPPNQTLQTIILCTATVWSSKLLKHVHKEIEHGVFCDNFWNFTWQTRPWADSWNSLRMMLKQKKCSKMHSVHLSCYQSNVWDQIKRNSKWFFFLKERKCILAIKGLSTNFFILYIYSHCAPWFNNLNILSIAQDRMS